MQTGVAGIEPQAEESELQGVRCFTCGKSLYEAGVITRDIIDPDSRYNAGNKPAHYNCPACYEDKRNQRRAEYAAAHPPVKSKKKKTKK